MAVVEEEGEGVRRGRERREEGEEKEEETQRLERLRVNILEYCWSLVKPLASYQHSASPIPL